MRRYNTINKILYPIDPNGRDSSGSVERLRTVQMGLLANDDA